MTGQEIKDGFLEEKLRQYDALPDPCMLSILRAFEDHAKCQYRDLLAWLR